MGTGNSMRVGTGYRAQGLVIGDRSTQVCGRMTGKLGPICNFALPSIGHHILVRVIRLYHRVVEPVASSQHDVNL